MDEGWVGLILCMMWEAAHGPESKWGPYFGERLTLNFLCVESGCSYEGWGSWYVYCVITDILPTRFDTPMFWSERDLEELKGTSVVGLSSGYSPNLLIRKTRG